MKNYYLVCLMLIASSAYAQRDGIVRGRLKDTATHSPVPDATITILNIKDSSLVNFSRSLPTGGWTVKGLSPGSYRALVTHVGYGNVSRNFSISDLAKDIDLGEIPLTDASRLLQEVTVTQEAPPVSLKHDTVEFNAGSFKTKPDAVVEDLLKKLPGIQVDKDGNIKAGGETVKKVLVDGKEFFGNDPKIASKNLPADAVDKVQVFDKKSDQSQFTGFDDGNSQKTINLTIKKDHKYGIFGRLTASGGRDAGKANGDFGPAQTGSANPGASAGDPSGRYDTKFNLNQFRGNRQFSALGMWNNVNRQGFSFQDALSFNNGNIGGGGGGGFALDNASIPLADLSSSSQAITTTRAGGANFSDTYGIGNLSEYNGSYFYNRADDKIQSKEKKQYLSPDNPFTQDLSTLTERYNQNHRVNMLVDHRIDSFNALKLTSSFTWQQSRSKSQNKYNSISGSDSLHLNDGHSLGEAGYHGYSWTNNALWRHKFATKGRTLSANLSFGLNDGSGGGTLSSLNNFYTGGVLSHSDTIDQIYDRSGHGNNYGAVLSYTEPLSKRALLEFNYNFSQTHTASGKNTFDADPTGKYTQPNARLTNEFNNTYTYHREGFSFRHQQPKLNYSIGARLQQALSSNHTAYPGGDSLRNLSFHNLLPNANLEYAINKYKNLRASYNTYTNQPSITQLQSVPDNSDPLNIKTGNPGLGQEYYHALRVNYMSFDPFARTSFFAMLSYDRIHNRIVNDDEIDAQGIRTSRPVNLDGLYKLRGSLTWDFPWRALSSRVSFNSNLDFDHNASIVNNARNTGNTWNAGQNASLEFIHKDALDITGSARLDYSDARYSLQPGQNMHYWTQTYNLDGSWTLPAGLSLESDCSYIRRSGLPGGYNSHPLVWNAGLASRLFANKKGLLKLQIFDILRQNTGFSRNTSQNYIDDMSYRVLNRYWLLTFSYSLSRFAGKNLKSAQTDNNGVDVKIMH